MEPELEDVPGQGLDREVLVQRADHRAGGLEDHRVVGVLRDRARVREGGHPRPAPGAEAAVHPVPVQEGAAPPAPRGEPGREHVDHRLERPRVEGAVGPGAPDEGEQGPRLPFAPRRHLGHDLLREHVERLLRQGEGVELAPADRVEERRALHEVVPAQGEESALRGRVDPVPGAPDPLQEGRDVAGGPELAHEVDVADVDAELERGGGDEEGEGPALQALLRLEPAFAREAAVVGGHLPLAEPFGEGAGGPLHEAPGVGEDEGGAVLAGERGDAVVDLFPHLGRHHRLERRRRQLDGEVAAAVEAFVDDRAGRFLPVPDEEARDERHRALGGGEPDPAQAAQAVRGGRRGTGSARRRAREGQGALHGRPPGDGAARLRTVRGAFAGIGGVHRIGSVHDIRTAGRIRELRNAADGSGFRSGFRRRSGSRSRLRRRVRPVPGAGAGEPRPGFPGAERFEPLQGQREVCAALVASDGVDLVHDDGAGAGERLPPRLAGEQDVERFRGGDEDVGRLADHRLAGRGRGVARARHRPDRDRRLAEPGGPLRDPPKGRLEVPLDVVGEGLERRHVDGPDRVVERPLPGFLRQLVDDREERREGLAGAGGRGDEGVAAAPDLGPRPRLAGGGSGELGLEPGADGGVAERAKRHRRTLHHGRRPANPAREPGALGWWKRPGSLAPRRCDETPQRKW